MNTVIDQFAAVFPKMFAEAGPGTGTGTGTGTVRLAIDGAIPQGQRNAHLASLAGSMRKRRMTPEAIAAALLMQNAQRCDPPLDDAEVRSIALSIGRYVPGLGQGLPSERLREATDVAACGRAIAAEGIHYLIDGIIPAYGMLGMSVAFAKVGKTTFGHALGAAVATGTDFLDRPVRQARVLVLAVEDPPEYTEWLARHLRVPEGVMTFYTDPLRFDEAGLDAIVTTVKAGHYGLVLVASWQAVVAGLVENENDNAASVAIVERVKLATRETSIPWLIDAHSGKGENQSDDADPTRAMRGASAAAGAADYLLSLRYGNGPFTSQRRLSGKGRFVSFEPILLNYNLTTGTYSTVGDSRSAVTETTWLQIAESGVLSEWCSVDAIATAIGQTNAKGRAPSVARRRIQDALRGRNGIVITTETRRGQVTTLYRLSDGQL